MDKTQAEALKVQILERRNHFRNLDIPLAHSKRNLHGGMQSRIARKEDKVFSQKVKAQRNLSNKNLNKINSYITKLAEYDAYVNRPMPISSLSFSAQSSDPITSAPTTSAPIPVVPMPIAPNILASNTSIKNKAKMVRKNMGGIKNRRYI